MLEITGFARLVMLGDHESEYGRRSAGAGTGPEVPAADPKAYPMTTSVRQFTAIHSDDEVDRRRTAPGCDA